LRLAGLLLAEGLILGRAIAGDWRSASATITDFAHDGWPAVILGLIAIVLERVLRPTSRNPRPIWTTHGLVPALAYLLVGLMWIARLGWWEGAAR